MPHDADPDEQSDRVELGPALVRLPPKPPAPVPDAETDAATRPTAKKPPRTKAPRRPAKASKPKPKPVDPGPPPPLPDDVSGAHVPRAVPVEVPDDLVIPPKPPLPVTAPPVPPLPVITTDSETESERLAEPVVEPEEPAVEPETAPVVEAAAQPDVAAAPEPESEVQPEPVVEPEHVVEPVPEPVVEPEPEPVVEVEPAPAAAVVPVPETVPDVLVAPAADPGTAALVLRGVVKRFGETHAVDGIDLTVPAGTFYGLVGPNGAGKTTTLSMIAGLLHADRGTITVNGVDAASDPIGAKRQMGVLPDRLRTFDRLTGRQLLHYYGVLRGLPSAVVESRTNDLARAFDLTDALGRVVSDYSAGMTKKVMLAGALIHSPRVLVLDEPFEAVDPVSSAIILDILGTYVSHGGTVILSSHGMDLVERVCSRVAVMVAGQVLAEGTIAEVRGELTLEQRFVELAGGLSDVEGLEWLHTFSD